MKAIVHKDTIKILICRQSKLQSGEPMDRWIDGLIGWIVWWIDGRIDQCSDQWIDWLIDLWIDQSMDRLIEW